MEEPSEITIRIHFEGGEAFPSSFVSQSLDVVEDEVFRLEYDELEEIFKELDGVPQVVKDACYHRIQRYKGNSFLLSSTSTGSIIVAGAVVALAYWLVKNTIGETIKDAYKESELHEKLKALLLRRMFPRSKELAFRLNQRLFKPISDPAFIAVVQVAEPAMLEVNLLLKRWEDVPPRTKQWIRPTNDSKF